MTRQLVTAAQLRAKNACEDQVALFEKLFPRGTRITLHSARVAARAGLNLQWFAKHFLSATALKLYAESTATALKLYEESRDTAWKLYHESRDTAVKLYEESTATTLVAAVTQTETEE